jgi:hypothetical protein
MSVSVCLKHRCKYQPAKLECAEYSSEVIELEYAQQSLSIYARGAMNF